MLSSPSILLDNRLLSFTYFLIYLFIYFYRWPIQMTWGSVLLLRHSWGTKPILFHYYKYHFDPLDEQNTNLPSATSQSKLAALTWIILITQFKSRGNFFRDCTAEWRGLRKQSMSDPQTLQVKGRLHWFQRSLSKPIVINKEAFSLF